MCSVLLPPGVHPIAVNKYNNNNNNNNNNSYQENGRRQLPSHPASSQFLRTVTKGGNICIKISDHTMWRT
jgi:hypothetical protein